ncbi:MAG TPA: FAD-dependent oxidoreductase [Burkholderiales bacterium]|nr:FAD-dependent oxidoreductase [Burkholderiales bacterium]
MSQTSYDVIVIGEGVSGLAAAGALAERGLKVATMEAQLFGGLVINVNELEPAPEGLPASGAELAAELMQKNSERDVTSIQEAVTALRDAGDVKEVVTDSGTYGARSVIVASGARLKKLGVPGEAEFEGRGVSQCADCDGPMYQNEDAIVVGGGDSAFQEALVLARYCRRVVLVHHGQSFKAAPHFVEQVKANGKITIIRNATVDAILGDKMVEKAHVRHTDGRSEEHVCAGVFAYIGLEPNAAFLPESVSRDAAGFVRTNESFETALPGVFAIGAVRSGFGGTLVDVLKEARSAAENVRARLG